MLVKNKVEIEKPYTKEIERNITRFYRLKPNRRFMLVINSRPYFYFMGSVGKDNWWKRFERNSLGEAPVLIDSAYLNSTINSFKGYLKGIGYYYSDVSYTIAVNKRKKAKVTYYVTLNKQYVFGDYDIQAADKDIYNLINDNMKETFIKTGRGFRSENLVKEQDRIITVLRNNGYFGMSKDFVNFDVDTSSPDGFVRLALNITNKDDTTIHKKYYVNTIAVDIDRNLAVPSLVNNDTLTLDSIHYNMGTFKLNPNLLGRNIQFAPHELYVQQKFNRTYSRLSDLTIFRFINIQTSSYETKDSGFVNYDVKLIPSVKYTFTLEPQAITSDQNNSLTNQHFRNYGVAAMAQLTNRNVFHNAELFQLSYRTSFEAQGSAQTDHFFNATEQSLTASIIMPHILFLPRFDKDLRFQSTRTILSTSAIYELNVDYRRAVITSAFNYQFNKKLFTYFFTPLEVSYIKSEILNPLLKEQAQNDIFLQNLFSNNLIVNSRFGFIYNNKSITKGLSFVNIRWDALELAGNLLTAVNNAIGAPKNAEGSYQLFGVRYFQYARSAVDFRYNTIYDENNSTVFRLYSGLALPYGNTPDFVPYERRFFTGGVNSLRAWRPRSIGPGSYVAANQLDYSGEVKLEANAEYRFNIYDRWFEGAVFSDIGNVWAIKEDPNRPGADFKLNSFYKTLAWDAGLGIRLNFTVFIIRFDFAVPLHDPTYTLDELWVIKNASKQDWLLRNTNFNFGIGYPF